MAARSSLLAGKIQWTEEPGGLQSMGLQIWTRTESTYAKQTQAASVCPLYRVKTRQRLNGPHNFGVDIKFCEYYFDPYTVNQFAVWQA